MAQEKKEKGAAMGKSNLVVYVYEVGDGDLGWVEFGRILLRDGKITCDPADQPTLSSP
jgi:hypothetical protein